jgi:hypothetical protein
MFVGAMGTLDPPMQAATIAMARPAPNSAEHQVDAIHPQQTQQCDATRGDVPANHQDT